MRRNSWSLGSFDRASVFEKMEPQIAKQAQETADRYACSAEEDLGVDVLNCSRFGFSLECGTLGRGLVDSMLNPGYYILFRMKVSEPSRTRGFTTGFNILELNSRSAWR